MCEAREMSQASKPESSLHGWYVISMRPLGQHGGVRRSAAAFGARVVALSTIRLLAIDAALTLPAVLRCPTIIVTSPSAVRFAGAQVAFATQDSQQWLAIGSGTAAALRKRGVVNVRHPVSSSDSEALLALPELQEVAGREIGLITAPGGRGLLARELLVRGARLARADVYRRQAIPPTRNRLRALDALPATSALLFTSEEALAPVWEMLDPGGLARLKTRLCVVASDRLASRARELGFAHVLRAVNARPPSLLQALREHAAAARFR